MSRRLGVGALLLLVCAAAAVLAVVLASAARGPTRVGAPAALAPAAGPPPPADRRDLPALPAYVMNVALGAIDLTADAGAGSGAGDRYGPPVIVVSGDTLEIVVRPERMVPEKVAIKVFWRKQDRLRRWRPPYERAPDSTYRYRGPAERPFGRGPGQLIALVSPVEDVPDEVPAQWLEHPPSHWQILRQTIRWK